MHRLKGENLIKKHRQIAEVLTAKIASQEGVTGILYIGGLTRNFADKHSDIDIITLLTDKDEKMRKKLKQIGSKEQERTGVDIDLEIHFFEDFRKWKWAELNKWDFIYAEIVYDPDGNVKKLFNEKLKVSKDFWLKRIVVFGEYLKWYCCPPKKGVGTMVEAWVDRGDLVSAHYCLNYSVDLMIKVIFALNKEFVPPQKWRIHYSYGLKWLPQGYETLLTEATIVKSLTGRDLQRRLEAAREIWSGMLPKIKKEMGLTPATLSKLYVEKVLRQS
jgi:predicted nucleotidyltransferase